jgi:hypothetical protein
VRITTRTALLGRVRDNAARIRDGCGTQGSVSRGVKGVPDPPGGPPDPLTESLSNVSLCNRYIYYVRSSLTLNPCGAQVGPLLRRVQLVCFHRRFPRTHCIELQGRQAWYCHSRLSLAVLHRNSLYNRSVARRNDSTAPVYLKGNSPATEILPADVPLLPSDFSEGLEIGAPQAGGTRGFLTPLSIFLPPSIRF